jgi:hypothetical protein
LLFSGLTTAAFATDLPSPPPKPTKLRVIGPSDLARSDVPPSSQGTVELKATKPKLGLAPNEPPLPKVSDARQQCAEEEREPALSQRETNSCVTKTAHFELVFPSDDSIDDQTAEPIEEISPPSVEAPVDSAATFGLKPMSQLSINIAAPNPQDGFPEDLGREQLDKEPVIESAQVVGRDWAAIDYRWTAPLLCHGPILFEQLNAERYGITYDCLQPVTSAAHFFATVPILPYKVWTQGHDHCQYALGYYRPGSCAIPQCYRPRISADASLFEAGVILGIIFALP